ncbi:hypothetical protein [Saccharopolyspora shandongensis]|uniref:hypothetical protein n=1 Tax=Saccharopolyspora shandongensis TaxID=418495 RepID=UPI0033F11610
MEPDLPVVEAQEVGRREDRHVLAEVLAELLLRPENQAAHGGVRSVRADHEVESAETTAIELDPDTVLVLLQSGDRVVEDVLHLVLGHLVQHRRQVLAQELDVLAVQPAAAESVLLGPEQLVAGTVHHGHFRIRVRAARIRSPRPIRSITSSATPRMSTAWPPSR